MTLKKRLANLSLATLWMVAPALHAAERPVRFAAFGDMDPEGTRILWIANLLKTYAEEAADPANPTGGVKGLDFLLLLGDNNYEKTSIYDRFAERFPDYIKTASQNPKPEEIRVFSVPGNHDYEKGGSGLLDEDRLKKYRETFPVPPGGNDYHYYEFTRSPLHFFALDSNYVTGKKDPHTGKAKVIWDGPVLKSEQHKWFLARLDDAKKDAEVPWRIAFFHHPMAHSSSHHASESKPMAKWKLEDLGITAVLTGHVHAYERILMGNMPLFIAGAGGTGLYPFFKKKEQWAQGSQFRHPIPFPTKLEKEHFGVLFGEATKERLSFEFRNADNKVLDRWSTP